MYTCTRYQFITSRGIHDVTTTLSGFCLLMRNDSCLFFKATVAQKYQKRKTQISNNMCALPDNNLHVEQYLERKRTNGKVASFASTLETKRGKGKESLSITRTLPITERWYSVRSSTESIHVNVHRYRIDVRLHIHLICTKSRGYSTLLHF